VPLFFGASRPLTTWKSDALEDGDVSVAELLIKDAVVYFQGLSSSRQSSVRGEGVQWQVSELDNGDTKGVTRPFEYPHAHRFSPSIIDTRKVSHEAIVDKKRSESDGGIETDSFHHLIDGYLLSHMRRRVLVQMATSQNRDTAVT
jgi:hypothetical protein